MRSPKLGQHFLHDEQVLQRIIECVAPRAQDRFVEIGPGRGQLTKPLLASGAQVNAIELDRSLAEALPEKLGSVSRRLSVTVGDAVRGLPLPAHGVFRLVGNLPYAISSPLLTALADYLPRMADGHVMLQKEFAQRLASAPGSRTYGRLSVAVQAFFAADVLFEVPAEAFRPPPKVASAFARLRPLPEPKQIVNLQAFNMVTRQAFAQRRKRLSNALASLPVAVPEALAGLRAEMLGVDDFVRLANQVAQAK